MMFGWDIMCLHFQNKDFFSEHFTRLPAWESPKLATEASSSLSNLRNSVSLAAQKSEAPVAFGGNHGFLQRLKSIPHIVCLPEMFDVEEYHGIPNVPGASSSNLHADVHVIHHIRRFESVSKIVFFMRKTVIQI